MRAVLDTIILQDLMPTICLFEDATVSHFYPLSDTRHLAGLRAGDSTFWDRAGRYLVPDTCILHSDRPVARWIPSTLASPSVESFDDVILINSLLYVNSGLARRLRQPGKWMIVTAERIAAARLPGTLARELLENSALWTAGAGRPDVSVIRDDSIRLFESLWELVGSNGTTIVDDATERSFGRLGRVDESARLLNEQAVHLGEGSSVGAGAVLDAGGGPIIVEEGAIIMHGAVIVGPAVIGEGSIVRVGSRIYPGTTIGPHCKVGGEVEDSIFLGYSNKQHDGFVGHTYVGEWVNLGADTNTSDLKNNYGSIRVRLDGVEVDTGMMFLGSLIGDHVKTGINTMFNTGTVVGVGANVFGSGFPPKEIPRFAWGLSGDRFDVDRAVDLARIVMGRRAVEMTPGVETLLRYLHGLGGNFRSAL